MWPSECGLDTRHLLLIQENLMASWTYVGPSKLHGPKKDQNCRLGHIEATGLRNVYGSRPSYRAPEAQLA